MTALIQVLLADDEAMVRAGVRAILDKLDARNRVQAAILAYEAGLT